MGSESVAHTCGERCSFARFALRFARGNGSNDPGLFFDLPPAFLMTVILPCLGAIINAAIPGVEGPCPLAIGLLTL